jgi:glycosyltransferase involved in cell wall biosynthesis
VDHSLAGLLSAFQPAWREKDVPLVRTRHVTTPVKGGQANRWLYERADLLLATASCIQSELLERFPALRPPVKVFHGGVDTQRFSPATPPAGLRKELGLSDNSLLVGSIGHLDPVKGYKNAIDVLAELPDSLPEVHLVICGKEGTQSFQELKQYAQNRSVAAKVHLLGFRRDIDRVITGLDVGLITSTGSEGNSRTALELMASGRPVVSTTAGCLPDLIEPGVQGCLAKPNQVKELADFLSRLLADENLRRRMGESARRRAVEHYDERSVAVELESLYEDLLSRK